MNFLKETGIIQYLTPINVIAYLLIINLIGLLIMFIDKRKAIKGGWRIPEKSLMLIALLGGSVGTIIGMYWFRHKTQKFKFIIGFPDNLINRNNSNNIFLNKVLKNIKCNDILLMSFIIKTKKE